MSPISTKKPRHWRTTVAGILSAIGTVLTAIPIPPLPLIGSALAAAGQALLGLAAHDARNGTPQPPT